MPKASTLQGESWKQRLHDGPLQEAISLWMQARCAPELAPLSRDLEELITALRGLLADETIPSEGSGTTDPSWPFAQRVQRLAEGCSYAAVSVAAHIPADCEPTHTAPRLALRTVAEALANLRHADAATAKVEIHQDGDTLRVIVTDDGTGFDVARALRPRPGHLGLVALRQDVADAGGRLEITTVPGRGSRIRVELPGATGVRSLAHPLAPAGRVLLRISA